MLFCCAAANAEGMAEAAACRLTTGAAAVKPVKTPTKTAPHLQNIVTDERDPCVVLMFCAVMEANQWELW